MIQRTDIQRLERIDFEMMVLLLRQRARLPAIKVSKETGIPVSRIHRLSRGEVRNPRYNDVRILFNFARSRLSRFDLQRCIMSEDQ